MVGEPTVCCRNPLLSPNTSFTEGRLLKEEWWVTYVTPVESPYTAEGNILKMILHRPFLADSGQFCGEVATL